MLTGAIMIEDVICCPLKDQLSLVKLRYNFISVSLLTISTWSASYQWRLQLTDKLTTCNLFNDYKQRGRHA